MNSHIQLPKFIMKNFMDTKLGRVHYIELSTMRIRTTGIKTIGTSEGYYYESTEEFLNKEIETPMSALTRKIISYCERDTEDCLLVGDSDRMVLINYICSLICRSDYFEKSLMEHSVYASELPKQFTRDFAVRNVNTVTDINEVPFADYQFGIIYNITNFSFVVPRNGCFIAKRGDELIIVVPISLKCSLTLEPQEAHFDLIDDADSVRYLNVQAILSERKFNNSFVLTDNIKDLQDLRDFYVSSEYA